MRTNISPILNLKRAVRTNSISIITVQTVKPIFTLQLEKILNEIMVLYFTINSDYHLVYKIGLFIHTTRSKTLEFKSVMKSLPYVSAFKVLFKVYKMGSNLKL